MTAFTQKKTLKDLRISNQFFSSSLKDKIILCNAIFTHNRSKTVYDFRDAWGFGALDPNSGTAQMMEVARVLGARLRTGWRPRRTIMFLRYCTVLCCTVLYCTVLHYCTVLCHNVPQLGR